MTVVKPYNIPFSPDVQEQDLETLASSTDAVCFSYSPKLDALLRCQGDTGKVLGVKDISIMRDGSIFLRYLHPDDKFTFLNRFESALENEREYFATYRWIRPDNKETRWLHCRASIVDTKGLQLLEGFIIDLSSALSVAQKNEDAFAASDFFINSLPEDVIVLDSELKIVSTKIDTYFTFDDPDFASEKLMAGNKFLDCFRSLKSREVFASLLESTLAQRQEYYRQIFYQKEQAIELSLFPLVDENLVRGIFLRFTNISKPLKQQIAAQKFKHREKNALLLSQLSKKISLKLLKLLECESILEEHVRHDNKAKEELEKLHKILQQAKGLSDQINCLEDDLSDPPSFLDINAVVMSVINRADDLIKVGVNIDVSFNELPELKCDKNKLELLLENLLRGIYELNPDLNNISISTRYIDQSSVGEFSWTDRPENGLVIDIYALKNGHNLKTLNNLIADHAQHKKQKSSLSDMLNDNKCLKLASLLAKDIKAKMACETQHDLCLLFQVLL